MARFGGTTTMAAEGGGLGIRTFWRGMVAAGVGNALESAWYPMVCGVVSLLVLVGARAMFGMGRPQASPQIASE